MAANQLIQARIDSSIKKEAAAVLADMGLTLSDAIRLLLTRVAREKALPFALSVPNAETAEAICAARRGEVETTTLEELQAVLDAGEGYEDA